MNEGFSGPRLFGLLGWGFLVCAVVVGISRFKKTALPAPGEIDEQLHAQPAQTETEREPFEFTFSDKTYLVTPRAEYDIAGLVVAHNNVSSLGDIYHDADAVDIKDLGLIWGDNLAKNPYRKVKFRANCYVVEFRYPYGVTFDHSQISNNHLLAGDPSVRQTIMAAKVGDQVRLKGILVDYKDLGTGGERKTSMSRTDTWMGACEVMFVEDAEIVKAGNVMWTILYGISAWGAIGCLVALIAAFVLRVNRESKALEVKRATESDVIEIEDDESAV
jgi:hypothetical protein